MKLGLKILLLIALIALIDTVLLRPHRQLIESERRNAAPDPQFNIVVERLAHQEPTTHPTAASTAALNPPPPGETPAPPAHNDAPERD
jgi:hypothetical protein